MYRPLGADLDRGVIQTIGFPYSSASCQDTLRARVQGASYRPVLVADEPSVDVGVVLTCAKRVDTVVSLTNQSLVPVTVSNIVGQDVTYTGGTVTIPAKTSRLFSISLTPSVATGAFSIIAKAVLLPCNDSVPVQFDGVMLNATYTQDRDEIDFGTILLCERSSASASFSISARGLSGLRSRLTSISVRSPFVVSVTAGQSFRDSLRVNVTFTPPGQGAFIDTIIYSIDPCSVARNVIVRGVAVDPKRSTSITSTDFGMVTAGSSAQRMVTVTNTGTADVVLEALEGVTAPFRIATQRPALPARLTPGQKAEIDIEYVFADYDRRDTIRMVSRTSGSCPDTTTEVLTGSTVAKGTVTGLSIVAPIDARAFAGEAVTLPFTLTSIAPLDSLDLRQMTIDLAYDPRLMRPDAVTSGLPGASASIQELVPGRATVTITSTRPIVAVNPFFSLRARTYVAEPDVTILDVDTAIAQGTIITGRDGQLTVLRECDITAGSVSIKRPVVFRVLRQDNSVLQIEFSSVTSDLVDIMVASLTGHVTTMQVKPSLADELHRLDVSIDDLPSGAYVLHYQHGRHARSIPFTIVR